MIKVVSFDVGETLIDETREYGTWADWLDVPRHTFSAMFGAVIARGGDYRDTFQVFRPGFNLDEERQRRADAGHPETFTMDDMYPDALRAIHALGSMGLRVNIAGNQTARAGSILRSFELPVESIATSDDWGVVKPSPDFFDRLITEMNVPAQEILYVGDRLDNDIAPAQEVGLQTALIRRGPWGHILDTPAAEQCLFTIESLDQLPGLISQYNTA